MQPNDSPFRILDFGQVQVQVQVGRITERNFAMHLRSETERIRQRIAESDTRGDRVVVIVDGSVALMPPAGVRRLQAQWLTQHEELLRQVTHKMAFVLPNPLVRAFVTAVFALVPLPVPSTTHASLEDAVGWSVQEIEGLGGQVAETIIQEGSEAVERAKQKVRAEMGLA